MNELLQTMDPADLREDIIEMFVSYVQSNHHALPEDFQSMADRIHVLLDYLKAEHEKRG